MTDRHTDDAGDEQLRAMLRDADPASTLPAAAPDRVARLLEDTMSDQHTIESRTDGTHDRSRLTWLVAAAAAVLIAGGVVFAVTQSDDDATPPTASEGQDQGEDQQDDPAPSTTDSVTALSLDGDAVSARCVAPQDAPDVVGAQSVAFDGTVTSISGGVVTLEPTRFFTGEETDLVTVRAVDRDMQALLAGVRFEEGERYLVSATDGRVTLCGFSAPYSESLAEVYQQAFAG